MKNNLFLFSIDLEDVRFGIKNGLQYKASVEALVEAYLTFLNQYKAKATFFTVGNIPKHYPDLIKMIVDEGHEIACHSNQHIPVTNQTESEFRDDVFRNVENLLKAGANEVIGYRAPIFSITKETSWAYDVLADMNFVYSSSILPAKNPLYGWENFGEKPKKMGEDLWEIPMSLRKSSFFKVPFSGGVYFRFLPFFMIKKSFSQHFKEGRAVTSYFHPYDIDTDQERFMHPGIDNNRIYNQLLYCNRKGVFPRLHKIMDVFQPKIITYKSFVELLEKND
ncbi:polysaccharide deacetylase family protein [Aquimarina rubra]|uniref:Polysaccharide deacetylase family protein n=1 Tax=Aquimarina rubra TaxID=1920033 RepID=A0ABW5LJG0_9FLAO